MLKKISDSGIFINKNRIYGLMFAIKKATWLKLSLTKIDLINKNSYILELR